MNQFFMESIPGLVFWKSNSLQYLGANQAFLNYFGFNGLSDLIGKKDKDLVCSPKIKTYLSQFDHEVILSGQSQLGIQDSFPKKDKEDILSTDKYPVFDESNQIIGILCLASIKPVSYSNSTVQTYLEKIIASVPYYIFWKDENSVYLGCNQKFASLVNKTPKEVIGKTDFELGWKEWEAQSFIEGDKAAMSGSPKDNVEETLLQPDGSETIMLVSKVPVLDSDGSCIGVLGVSVDITERKKMEGDLIVSKNKADLANLAKSEFLANISHDIRTPLTGIITFSRFLKDQDDLGEAERKELATDTYYASEQLLNLLNGVLDVVSADTATDHDLNLKSFNLIDMIDDLIQLEKPAVKSHHLELRKSIDKNIPKFVISDRMKLHRILLNLIGNAIKFTEKGYLKLSAKLQEKDDKKATIIFSVEDTGIGIPEEAQSQIFERFYKVTPSYKGKYTGNGIGLNIVRTYLHLLGGEIDFHSIIGKGATFLVTLTFPISKGSQEDEDSSYREMLKQEREEILLEEEITLIETSATTDHIDNIDSSTKILLVEDNILALKSLKTLFMPFKFRVMEAQNAEDAFELVKQETFDLIITDIGLPGMQGDELVAKIRQLESKTGRIRKKIVALTGHAVGGELADKCKKAGIDELFKKPMQPTCLKSLLDPLMKSKPEKAKLTPKSLEKSSSSKGGKLGVDLPDTEAQLFEIDHHPLLDLKVGEAVLGSEDLVKDILRDLNQDGIVPELDRLKNAHEAKDWETVRALAHKMKGGATFGTVRLYYALLYMERYIKAEHMHCAEDLYTQMLRVIDETVEYLDKHL